MAVAIVTAAMTSSASAADPWPQRTVRLIAPISAGTATDLAARLFAEHLSKRWGQPVVVENRPGGDGIVAVNALPLRHRPPRASPPRLPARSRSTRCSTTSCPTIPGRTFVPVASAIDNFSAIAVASSPRCRHDHRLHRDGAAPAGQAQLGRDAGPAAVHLRRLPEAGGRGPRRGALQGNRADVAGSRAGAYRRRRHRFLRCSLPLVDSGKAGCSRRSPNRERSPLAPQVPTALPKRAFPICCSKASWASTAGSACRPTFASASRPTSIAAAADPALVERLRAVGLGGPAPARRPTSLPPSRTRRRRSARWPRPRTPMTAPDPTPDRLVRLGFAFRESEDPAQRHRARCLHRAVRCRAARDR